MMKEACQGGATAAAVDKKLMPWPHEAPKFGRG